MNVGHYLVSAPVVHATLWEQAARSHSPGNDYPETAAMIAFCPLVRMLPDIESDGRPQGEKRKGKPRIHHLRSRRGMIG